MDIRLYGACGALLLISAVHAAAADEPAPPLTLEQTQFFEQKVRPLLVERCYACHSPTKRLRGGLALDSRAGWVKGGDSGPVLVPGKPDESRLIQAVRYQDADLKMPPDGRLPDAEMRIGRTSLWERPRYRPLTTPGGLSTRSTASSCQLWKREACGLRPMPTAIPGCGASLWI
jgi:hypothetical protein